MDPEKWLDFAQNISKEISSFREAQNLNDNIIQLNKAWQLFSSTILQNAKKHIPHMNKTS